MIVLKNREATHWNCKIVENW